ncbi:MAG: hypothetical protein GX410_01335, partial [Elusimicrobia bacterium]|nr:hypothetical protein [Elusimicrobiota bacterium]
MKNILLSALFFVCSIAHNALASGLSEADSLFDKGRFDKAAQAYEVAAKGSVGDDKLRAVYRAVQSKALSFAYAEAAQRLLEEPLPNDRLWQARFLLLRAELFRQYLRQYGRAMPADRQDSASDVTRWSAAQWHERIQAAYQLLWPLRGELSRVSLASESYFMKKGEPEEDIPTLLDFLVYSWSDYLLTQAPAGDALPDAAPFVVSQYPGRLDFSMPPAHVAALLMTEASGANVHKERRKAAELWRIRRLLLPFEHQDRFKLPEDMKSLRLKAGTVLARWTEVFTLPETRAEAAYHAADFLEQDGDYAAAVQLCKRAASLWHGTPGAAKCERLKARIEMPSLSITAHNTPPGGGNAFSINVRNMDSVYCRLYKTTPQELLRLSRRGAERDYYYLLGLDSKAVQDGFLARKADREWKVSPAYPAQYVAIRQDVDAAGLERGLYVAIVSDDDSFRPGSSFISAGIVNCTDLFLLGSAGFRARPGEFFFAPELGGRGVSADGFHLYAVDALSGAPVQGANISAFYDQDFSRRQKLTAATDKYGMASLRSLFTLAYPASSNYRLAPLAERGKSLAYWGQEGGFSYSVPAPLELYLETDRPVYRPGQEVSFKATVLRRTADGFAVQSTPLQVRVSAHDANYQEFGVLTLKTNGMGSVSGSFKIPQGRLLGGYTLRAVADAYGAEFESSQGFAVEEYKRPEFELKLGEAKDAWRYGRKAVVRGKASYYFGGPVPQAKVSYQIYRRRYMPWYAWWAFWFRPDSPKAEVASGSVQTDQDGNFSIEFKPAPEPGAFEKEPSSFIVEAQAHDAGGRTITDSKTYQAGARAYMFKVDLPAGFARPWASYDIAVRLMNLNDTQVLGRGSYALYRLEPVLKDDGVYASGGGFGWGGQPQAAQRLEEAFLDVPDGAKVQSGDFLFSDVGAEHVRLKNLPEGIYRLQLKADDIWGGVSEQSLIVLSAGNEPKLPIPSVAMSEQKTCQVGETARVLAGSSELKGALYAEIWAGNFLLGRQVFAKGGLRVLEIPVEREHVGGFAVRWFGASDFKIYSGQELVDVPRPEKDLSVSLDAPKTQEPGSQANWLLTVKDSQGRPVQGEALVKVYDRSLEYYASAEASWLDALYQANGGPGMLNMPFFDTPGMSFPVKKGLLASLWQTVRGGEARSVPPSLRLGGGDNYYAEGMAYGGGAMMRKSLSA